MKNKFKRIILHWTAGPSQPTACDRKAYHYLIDTKGFVHNGVHRPEANLDCSDGVYAAHTGGGNTASIGVALCGMARFSYPSISTPYPLTKLQLETAFSFIAKLCKRFQIPISEDTIMTHFEFGLKNPATTSHGKIDIVFMHPYPTIHKYEVGNFIRNKVKWYFERL
ncbi:MAG: peptidoglycan recognition family protein [Sulfurospirillaceae bacterium]|nr:peptidoglycan recognition family protein [Sulfurospirillaceae bacterium]